MNLLDYLKRNRGKAAAMAESLGVAAAYMSQMARGDRPVQPWMVKAIRGFTADEVREWDLRPLDWHRIWPELIGQPGAPGVTTKEAA